MSLRLNLFRKVNQHVPLLALPQMCQNIFFPQHLVRYLETIDLKDKAGDALILLINLFDDRCV